MKYFKKYPVFFAVLSLLIAAFVAGVGIDIWLALERTAAEKKLERSMRSYGRALKEDPTQTAIDASVENIKQLQERLLFLERDLTRASGDIFKTPPAREGYQLVEQLRGLVNKWRKDAVSLEIKVSPEMDFGFKKYVAPNSEPPKDEAVSAIWKQASVMNYINQKLFACKSDKSPMAILAVQRELLTEESVPVDPRTARRAPVRRVVRKDDTTGDNFKIDTSITARKEGSLDTIAFRYIFTGHTDVLRRFLNQLKDFDAMLVVRSIDVKPADMSQVESLDVNPEFDGGDDAFNAIFGSQSENPSADGESLDAQNQATGEVTTQNVMPVVTDNVSEFTVVIEYVEVVKEAPAAEADSEDSDEAETK